MGNGQIRDFILTSAFSAPCSCAPKPKEIPTVQEPHEVHTLLILDVRTFVVRQGSLDNYMNGKAMDMVSIRELLCINSKLSPYYLPWRQIHPTRWLFPALKAELDGVTGWFLQLLFFQAPLRRLLSFRQLMLECLIPRNQTGELRKNKTAPSFIEVDSHNSLWTLSCQWIHFCFPLPGSGLKAIRVRKSITQSIQRTRYPDVVIWTTCHLDFSLSLSLIKRVGCSQETISFRFICFLLFPVPIHSLSSLPKSWQLWSSTRSHPP